MAAVCSQPMSSVDVCIVVASLNVRRNEVEGGMRMERGREGGDG